MDWYLKVLRQYSDFEGRAQRSEYWFFVLINVIVTFILAFLDSAFGMFDPQTGWGVLSAVYALALFLPSLAVSVRRLHDTGRSGWWMLLLFVPMVGALVLIFFFVLESQADANRYGMNPKR